MRLIRIIRILRTLRTIGDLRTIIVSIFGTMRTLVWTLLLMFLVLYVIAITIMQLVAYHLLSTESVDQHRILKFYYGSLSKTILVLFQTVSNGIDWENMLTPLMDYISPWMALPICFYIGFVIFALMNIVTGVFV